MGGKEKKEIDVKTGPFAAFGEKLTASLMQKFIMPWNIAIHWLSYSKKLTDKDIKAQLIAIIDSENLMPGYASCAEQASKYSVAFGDLVKKCLMEFLGTFSYILSTYLTVFLHTCTYKYKPETYNHILVKICMF